MRRVLRLSSTTHTGSDPPASASASSNARLTTRAARDRRRPIGKRSGRDGITTTYHNTLTSKPSMSMLLPEDMTASTLLTASTDLRTTTTAQRFDGHAHGGGVDISFRSEEHTSELQ